MLRIPIASLPRLSAVSTPWMNIYLNGCQSFSELREIFLGSLSTTRIFLIGRSYVREDIQRYFTKAVVIPITPNMDDIRNYLEMLDRDSKPDPKSCDLQGDIMNVTVEKVSNIGVGPFRISPLSMMYTDQ